MLLGNVVNGTIGKQMVDTLVESASNVEVRNLVSLYFIIYVFCKVSSTFTLGILYN